MKATDRTHIIRRIICWVVLLQMIHVSMDTVSPSSFSQRGFFYETTPSNTQTDTLFGWLAGTVFNPSVFHQDTPSNDKSEESNFLEEFSIGLIWPPIDLEFTHTGGDERFADNFRRYSDNFVPHYSEPNSPPPNQA
ncbi:hypothetical protein [Runella sp.]|jgi:hypothetical protein|uniref:hypothetical protein n=1 Tax=Runella sp. TaxID=1960881 RepID=UPI002620D97F|nr:hypothetical protein [Runella sp.]